MKEVNKSKCGKQVEEGRHNPVFPCEDTESKESLGTVTWVGDKLWRALMSKRCARKNAHTNPCCKVQHMFHMMIGK